MNREEMRRWAALVVTATSSLGAVYACDGDDGITLTNDAGAVDSSIADSASNDVVVDQSAPPLECEVAIVGGGPGGLHTAFRLTNPPPDAGVATGVTTPSGVCLFEKNDRLGGRVRDVQFGPDAGDVTGTGAYRMYENQYTYQLANELGITTQKPVDFSTLRAIENPGGGDAGQAFGYGGDSFKALYGQTLNDDNMWEKLLCGAHVPKDANKFPNYGAMDGGIAGKSFSDYTKDVLGAQGAQFFYDQNRFRADFAPEVDAVGYLEYGVIDWYGAGPVRYPLPGHSASIGKMQAAVQAKGGRIFLSEPVKSITSTADGSFTLQTGARSVRAKQVVLALPQNAIAGLTGDVIQTITSAKEYGSVTSAKSMQVTHQWDKTWWKGDLRYPNASKVVGENLGDAAPPVLRADTTITTTNGHCINAIEMPFTAHHDGLKVTRSVYSDNRACVEKNLTLYGTGDTAGVKALNDEILKSLKILFPAVFDGSANEPKIMKTDVNVHDEAWFYLKKGSTSNGVTNKSLFDWSVNPVAGKKIYLVGDTWYPLGSGWMVSAYISSIRVLNTHFGLKMAPSELVPAACP